VHSGVHAARPLECKNGPVFSLPVARRFDGGSPDITKGIRLFYVISLGATRSNLVLSHEPTPGLTAPDCGIIF
jgi:hypothetical protein